MSDTTKAPSKKTTAKATTARKTTTTLATGTATATKPRAKRSTRTEATTTVQTRTPSYDQIALRARTLYEQSGNPAGRDEEFWLEAERQLLAELAR